MSDEEDDTLEAFLRSKAADHRRSKAKGGRRGSSPFLSEGGDSRGKRRRFSSFTTTSSGDETAISIEDGELNEEEVLENMRLNKQLIESVKLQPWSLKKKYKALRRAKAYVNKHEGELAHSKRKRDIFAKYSILFSRGWQRFKREIVNFVVNLTPWEMRIKKIESHFGSVVASYFLFLRWVFWVNVMITAFVCCFLMVPEVLRGTEDPTGMRKEVESEERDSALNLKAIWDFEGYLKYSPLFYGYYSNREQTEEGYRLPLAYFLTSLSVYIFSFFCILRRMAENSRMSKLSEKDDECTFSWKLYTGWDYMIGNAETAYNKTASLIMSLKEAILEEKERKKEITNWKIIILRVIANFTVLILLASSAYAVVLVVERSQQPEAESSWYRQNEVTLVVSFISIIYPNLFDAIGIMERYHPRVQLRWQLGRILILYLLNLYTLIFALFAKVLKMTKDLERVRVNITTSGLLELAEMSPSDLFNVTLPDLVLPTDIVGVLSRHGRSALSQDSRNCTLLVLHNCTLAMLKKTQGDLFSLNASIILDIIASSSKIMDHFGPLFPEIFGQSTDHPGSFADPNYDAVFLKIANYTAVAFANWSSTPGANLGNRTDGDGSYTSLIYHLANYTSAEIANWTGTTGSASTPPSPETDYNALFWRIANFTVTGLAGLNQSTPFPNYTAYSTDSFLWKLTNFTSVLGNWTLPTEEVLTESGYNELLWRIANYTASGYANWTSLSANETNLALIFSLLANISSSVDGSVVWPHVNVTTTDSMTEFYTEMTTEYPWLNASQYSTQTPTDNCTLVISVCPDMFGTQGSTVPPYIFTDVTEYTETDPGMRNDSAMTTTETVGGKTGDDVGSTTTMSPMDCCKKNADLERAPSIKELLLVDEEIRDKLRKLCWETMFGQELVKLTVMDLVMTIISTILMDFIRAVFVRYVNRCWCWDLEKKFPGYGDFKIAENILHLVNNQGMIWMGMFFSPGLPAINTVKLCLLMYVRSWAVLTCNIPHETVFRASRSNNFYFALLLIMLFLCTLPVGYAVVWLQPSWHCGPFSGFQKIYKVFTSYLESVLPSFINKVLEYVTSPGVVIPLFMLLVLIIYYLMSLTGSLREANNDLRFQLRREKNELKTGGAEAEAKAPEVAVVVEGVEESVPTNKWSSAKKILPVLPNKFRDKMQQMEDDEATEQHPHDTPEKKSEKAKKVQYTMRSDEERSDDDHSTDHKRKQRRTQSRRKQYSMERKDSKASANGDVPVITISQPGSLDVADEDDDDRSESQERLTEDSEKGVPEQQQMLSKSPSPSPRNTSESISLREFQSSSAESQDEVAGPSSASKHPPPISETPLSFRTCADEHSRSVSPIYEEEEHQPAHTPTHRQSSNDDEMASTASSSREQSVSPRVLQTSESEQGIPLDDPAVRRARIQRLATDSL